MEHQGEVFGHASEKEVAKAWAHKRARQVVDSGGAAQVLVLGEASPCDEAGRTHRPAHRGPTLQDRYRTAAAEGIDPDEMALHLTLGDVEQLKRDRAIAVADISFTGGTMRYLGVKVVKGDTPASELRRPVAENP